MTERAQILQEKKNSFDFNADEKNIHLKYIPHILNLAVYLLIL